jgi:O-antigen/teichoic acid export membrane protein
MASQTMIITRRLGLQAAAAWSVGTRAFTLVSQAVWRVSDVSGPAFAEMMARGEHVLLRERYKAILILTASLSGFSAVIYALCNSAFVTVWTHGKFAWPSQNDVLLGVWMIVMAVLHSHNMFVLLTRQIRFMRYIYFLEGICFVTMAFLAAKRGGLPAVIVCPIVCSTTFSGAYGVWRVSRYFDRPVVEVGLRWMIPMARGLGLFVPASLVCWWGAKQFEGPLAQLVFNASVGGLVGLYLFLRYGLPQHIQTELLERAPKRLVPALRLVMVSSSP